MSLVFGMLLLHPQLQKWDAMNVDLNSGGHH